MTGLLRSRPLLTAVIGIAGCFALKLQSDDNMQVTMRSASSEDALSNQVCATQLQTANEQDRLVTKPKMTGISSLIVDSRVNPKVIYPQVVVAGIQHAGTGPVLNTPSDLSAWVNSVNGMFLCIGAGQATLRQTNYLNLTFGLQSGVPSYEDDTAYTSSAADKGVFTGLALKFKFYARQLSPLSAVVYMHSKVTPGGYWQYAFADSATPTGTSQQDIQFVYGYGNGWTWSAGPGSQEQFESDLENVDWIGVNISRALDTAAQDYQIDGWQYYALPRHSPVALLTPARTTGRACLGGGDRRQHNAMIKSPGTMKTDEV